MPVVFSEGRGTAVLCSTRVGVEVRKVGNGGVGWARSLPVCLVTLTVSPGSEHPVSELVTSSYKQHLFTGSLDYPHLTVFTEEKEHQGVGNQALVFASRYLTGKRPRAETADILFS